MGFKLRESPKKKLDIVDLQIIRALEEDSRVSLRKLAHRVGLTPNIVHNRLDSLEHEGVILGYAPVIDAAKMGYALTAIIMIQVEGGILLRWKTRSPKKAMYYPSMT